MTTFPPLTHVAVTVRDLSVSTPWYERLFDVAPVLDEDTDPDFHHTVYLLGNTLFGLHQHGNPAPTSDSASTESGSTTSRSVAPTEASSSNGHSGSTSSASSTAGSKMPPTVPA